MNIEQAKLIYLTIPLYTQDQYKELVEKVYLNTYGEEGNFKEDITLDTFYDPTHSIIIKVNFSRKHFSASAIALDVDVFVYELMKYIHENIEPNILVFSKIITIYGDGSVKTISFGYNSNTAKVHHIIENCGIPYIVKMDNTEEEVK